MRREVKSLIVGMVTGLAGVVFSSLPMGFDIEQQIGMQWLFKLRGQIAAPDEVAVVAIDHQTGRRLDLPTLPRDWPRTVHAELVSRLLEHNVAVIAFDMSFHLSRSPEDDRVFAQAIERAGRVALISRLDGKRVPLSTLDLETDPVVADADNPVQGRPASASYVWIEHLLPPTFVLANAAAAIAPFPLPKTQDNIFRFWVFKSSADDVATLPTVALELFSREVQEHWLAILHDGGLRDFESNGLTDENTSTASALREKMRRIRSAFYSNPNLTGDVKQAMAARATPSDDARHDQLLTALFNLYSGEDNRILNLYGPPGSIATIPYHRILNSNAGADGEFARMLDGKVVFIGFSDLYDPDQPDGFRSAFTTRDKVDVSGVEIAATAFANLLHDHSINQLTPLSATALVFFFGAILAIAIYYFPVVYSIPFAIILSVVYVVVCQYLFSTHHYWLPLTTPILVQLPIALFTGLTAQYMFERREERKLTEAIGYYLPSDIVQELTQGGRDSMSVNKTVYTTCLATDMKGFTSLAETMNPDQLASFMNGYFEVLATALKNNDVDITEFRADGIMCGWISADKETVRYEAIVAAMTAAEAIKSFQHPQLPKPLTARIGIEAGWAYVGHSGGGGKFVYSILGDCANTASRIEGLNNYLGTEVLASQAIVESFKHILYRPLGNFIVAGKREPLAIVEILAEESDIEEAQLELCTRFAEALAYFQDQQWRDAADALVDLTAPPFNDGPSKFYLQRCHELLKLTTLPRHPTVIVMDKK